MYANNIDMRISPASLTKLMTALILFENYALAEELTVSLPSNYIYEGKVAYLKNGDNSFGMNKLCDIHVNGLGVRK